MPMVTRVIAVAAALLIGRTIPLSAQFEIGVFGGAHIERNNLIERRVRYDFPNDPPVGSIAAFQVDDRTTTRQGDWIATLGLRARFGKRPGKGVSHGPAVVPSPGPT